MRFVTDFLWRSPLGLRINAQDTAGVTQTEDWVKIRGDQLVARDGAYDVRISAELWETHFVDHVSLMVVDHPDDVAVFVDERFAREAPALAVQAMRPPQRRRARLGRDRPRRDRPRQPPGRPLSGHVRARRLSGHRRGSLRGARARRGDSARCADVARGVRVRVSDRQQHQRGHRPGRARASRAACRSKRWTPAAAGWSWRPISGFPAGKNKTILIDLGRVARAGVAGARRLRLRTNLEIYWDSLAYAAGVTDASLTDRAAGSRPRGPALPGLLGDAERPSRRARGARCTIGSPTRCRAGATWSATTRGSATCASSSRSVEDRYVIMNAGDELRLSFRGAASAGEGLDARLRAHRGWLGEGRRLQHELFEDRSAAAGARPAGRTSRRLRCRPSKRIPSIGAIAKTGRPSTRGSWRRARSSTA